MNTSKPKLKVKTPACVLPHVSKRYLFKIQDVDTDEIILIDEDTERKAFRKAFRFFEEKKLRDRELKIVSKVDNICMVRCCTELNLKLNT